MLLYEFSHSEFNPSISLNVHGVLAKIEFKIFLNSSLETYVFDSSKSLDLESYRSNFKNPIMSASRMRDNVERWLIHESLPFDQVKNEENSFQILVKHAGQYGIPVDIFEPKAQLGIARKFNISKQFNLLSELDLNMSQNVAEFNTFDINLMYNKFNIELELD